MIGSILRHKKSKNRRFFRLCDAIIDVILFMCFDAILGCDCLEKKRSIRCDFDAMRLPSLVFTAA